MNTEVCDGSARLCSQLLHRTRYGWWICQYAKDTYIVVQSFRSGSVATS